MGTQAIHAMEHFMRIAHQGKRSDSSNGELHARMLAIAIIQHSPHLDGEAVEGAAEFLLRVSSAPTTARDWLEILENANATGRRGSGDTLGR